MILVTGSEGLIGRHLTKRLKDSGLPVRRFDIRRSAREDTRNPEAVAGALSGVTGVVHLAAVSRVIWGERDPQLCWRVNVDATKGLLQACIDGARPWLIFASSREVYGQARRLPVKEDDALLPLNTYARSKCEGERLVVAAGSSGILTNIVRFSSVYGCPHDHEDRVAMAFARTAATGGVMSLEGGSTTLDFTSIVDVIDGLFRLVQSTIERERFPPIHFVSGRGTTLRELAETAAKFARKEVALKETAPRSFDVSTFVGNPDRAERLLRWRAQADFETEMSKLIELLATCRRPGSGAVENS